MKKILLPLISVIIVTTLAGCAVEIETTSKFDPVEAAYINTQGSATITGQAFMRQMGGGVVTCAGNEVDLIPAVTFSKERITKIYGNVTGGRVGALTGRSATGVDPRYFSMKRIAICDAQGNFQFDRVANGDYYLFSYVTWAVPGSMFPEGGSTAKLIQVRNGRPQRVIMN